MPLTHEEEVARLRRAATSNGQGDEDQDDIEDLASFEPIDLGPAWRGDKPRPAAEVFRRDDGLALLLPGVNYLFGDSGDGKSFVALIAALEEIRTGHPVIWISYEDANEDLIVDRLKLLGATEDEATMLRFSVPQVGLTAGTRRIIELAEEIEARLVVLDSVGEAMAVGGVDEDRDKEVGPWMRQTMRLIHNLNPTLSILPIDHSTKSKDNPLFPSGSKRKRAAVTGRMFLLNVRSPFAIDTVGYVQLVVAKDRGGRFKRADIAAEIMLDATDNPYRWTVTAPRDGDSYSPKIRRRTAADRVLEVLGEASVPMTAEQCARIANAPDRTQPGEARLAVGTVGNALAKLGKAIQVHRIEGPRIAGRQPLITWQMVNTAPRDPSPLTLVSSEED
jgi:AAA domain